MEGGPPTLLVRPSEFDGEREGGAPAERFGKSLTLPAASSIKIPG